MGWKRSKNWSIGVCRYVVLGVCLVIRALRARRKWTKERGLKIVLLLPA